MWLAWRQAEESRMQTLRHTNDVIGNYVTAGARLLLYGYLDKLQERALNTDTDSVVFIQPRDCATLVEIGDYLGAMTSELKPNKINSEYISGGPKNYAYKTLNSVTGAEKAVCKVRGITLNYNASQLVNFEKIKAMISGRDEKETITIRTQGKIKRKRGKDGDGRVNIISEPEDKTYRVSFFKRRRLDENSSGPFGYIKEV